MSALLFRFLLTLILLQTAGWRPAFAQTPPDYRLLGVNDGLSFRDVKFTTRDSKGFLWIINSGIDFYDGQSMTSYNKFDRDHYIPIDNIRTGCKLEDSLLIFTAAKDLYVLNMMTGNVRPMALPVGMNTDFNDIVSIVDRQHNPNLLIFTRSDAGTTVHVIDRHWKYLFHYDVPRTLPLHIKILRSCVNGRDGELWLLDQTNAQILKIDKKETISIPFHFEVNQPDVNYRLVYLLDFGLIICRNDGLITAIRNGTNTVSTIMQIPFTEPVLNPSHVTKDGWIWSLSNNQMVQFNVRSGEYHVFDVRYFGEYNPILRNSFEDEEGITWISSEVGLLEILPDPKPFVSSCVATQANRNFQFRDILPAGPHSVFCRAIAQKGVILELQMDDNLKVDTIIRLHDAPTNGIFQRHGDHLYHIVSGTNDLIRYRITDFKMERIILPVRATTQFYNLFAIDTTGMVYYQDINNQLTGFDPETHEVKAIPLEISHLKSPWRVLQFYRQDQIIIGTETTGLMFFDRNSGKLIRRLDSESTPALSGNFVNAVLQESDTTLWIGTLGAGLNQLNLTKGTIKIFTKLNGLPNDMIASIQQDAGGNLWIGTYGGLSMFSKLDERFYNYYVKDGLSDNEFNYLSSYTNSSGMMLMGTLNGITIFNPSSVLGNTPLPPVQLVRIERYNRKNNSLIVEDKSIDSGKVIYVSPYDNYMDLSFAVPSYKNNASHVFFSRLKGIDVNWQNLGNHPSVRYQKLPPGSYELELMAADANGNKTLQPTLINIHVQQVFYKSIWFISLLIIAGLCAIYSVYRYRVRLLQKELQMRTRIASDLHDEVGGSLTGLYLQMQMIEMQVPEKEKSSLAKANAIINESITKMRDLVWSIDARSDSLGKILERMEDYASDVLSPLDIRFTFQHHHIHIDQPIDARKKHNIYLIFKEAIHNIAKHSDATQVEILLESNASVLDMKIQDNGKPQLQQTVSTGQGLHNMQMRAEQLKGKLTAGYTDQGFMVSLQMQL